MAPIALFAYRRADHLRLTIASLLANPEAAESDLFVFCDAPGRPEHSADVQDVRACVEAIQGFRTISRVYRGENFGLARSVIEGVDQLVDAHGRVIVVEDDLVVSPHFLRYMNAGLRQYESDARVASIHGYLFPLRASVPETFFLRGADCWGWATWSRAWSHFEANGPKLLAELRARGLSHDFDYDGQYPYTSMLEDQIAGRNSSWAIRWHASCYLRGLLTLYPGRSLVQNIGNDSSGTHCGTSDAMGGAATLAPVTVGGIAVEPSAVGRAAVREFFASQLSLRQRVSGSLRRLLRAYA